MKPMTYIEALRKFGSQRQAGKALGISKDKFRHLLEKEKMQPNGIEDLGEIKNILSGTFDPPRRSSRIKSVIDSTNNIIPIFLWSDWHIGETVDPEQTFGYNEFNAKIAKERLDLLISRSIALARHESCSEKAILWLGGDFVSGWLHAEHVATDYCTPLQAIHWATENLYNAILDLLDEFKFLEIICSFGNHGRLGVPSLKQMAKLSSYTSYDWLIYSQLKSWLGNKPNITFNVPIEGDYLLEVNGHRFFFTHGNNLGVNGGNGEIGVIGPIMRGKNRILSSLSSMNLRFNTLVMGHVHQGIWMPGRGVIVNPCFIGYNEYAKMLRVIPEPAAQMLFFVHKDYGPIIPIEVYLK